VGGAWLVVSGSLIKTMKTETETHRRKKKERMKMNVLKLMAVSVLVSGVAYGEAEMKVDNVKFTVRDIPEIGKGCTDLDGVGVARRDPSDVIKLGDTYYVFYARSIHSDWPKYGWKKPPQYLCSGYYGTIWYATSPDGLKWTERGEAIGRGVKGKLDSNGVFSPNVVRAPDGKVYMYYTAVPLGFVNNSTTDYTYIFGSELQFGPDGLISGARRLNNGDPLLSPTAGKKHEGKPYFDSYRVDDSAMLWRDFDSDGQMELGLYYKGRAEFKMPRTMMGLAIAESPEGPFTRHSGSADGNIAQTCGHEVMVFALGDGVVSVVSNPDHGGPGVCFDKKGTKFAKSAHFAGKILPRAVSVEQICC
jgi:hypothetical protein